MKHLYKITLHLLLALFLPATALAYDFEVDGIYYNINGNEATVTRDPSSNKYTGDIVIPSTVTNNSTTYSVTSIGYQAFYNCSSLTSITIPESVTSIGSSAFSYCYGLTSITIPESVTSIGSSAFSYCYGLTSITIPSSVTSIGSSAFYLCYGLTSITIPSSVTSIGSSAFYGCYGLNSISVNSNNPVYDSRNNCNAIIKKSNNELIVGCKNTVIPSSVTSIGDSAFEGCLSLTSITIPESVTSIGFGAFSICLSLSSITIPSSVTSIGDFAFYSCTSLTSITIPSSVMTIGYYAFRGCSSLTSITIPEGVTTIGDYAFSECTSLTSITIPSSVTSIGEEAFCFCNNLSIVFISGNNEWQAGALPEGVKTLYIGSEVTGVKGMTVNPEKIYSYATTPPVCDENSFTGYDAELHVPAASMAAYFTAPYWCNFTNIIGDAVAVTDLSVNRDSVEMLMGEQISLHATVSPTTAVPNNVSWISSDNKVATVVDGVVTAMKGGECDIIATCQDKRAVCHVIVTEILPIEVTLNQDEAKIEIGSQLNLTATVLPENTSNKTVTWESTNSAVATVNDGIVTGVGYGECNIVATCGNKQAICHVIVVEHLIYITLDEHEARLLPNHLKILSPTVTPVATDLVVTSSNPAVAAARMAGNKIQVMGITEGTTTIYVNSADGYAFSDSCLVEVYTELGDVNCDGFVNISDVTHLIDYLLSGDVPNFKPLNADVSGDGDVTIKDVTSLIDMLLSGDSRLRKSECPGNPMPIQSFRLIRGLPMPSSPIEPYRAKKDAKS